MSSTIGLKWVLTRLGAIGLGVGLVVGLATMPASASQPVCTVSGPAPTYAGDTGGSGGPWTASCPSLSSSDRFDVYASDGAGHLIDYGSFQAVDGVFTTVSWWGIADPVGYSGSGNVVAAGDVEVFDGPHHGYLAAADSAPQGSSGGASYGSPGYSRDVAISLVDQVSNPVVDVVKNVLPILVPVLLSLWAMRWVMRKFGLKGVSSAGGGYGFDPGVHNRNNATHYDSDGNPRSKEAERYERMAYESDEYY